LKVTPTEAAVADIVDGIGYLQRAWSVCITCHGTASSLPFALNSSKQHRAVIERLLAGAQKGEDAKSRVVRLQSRHQLFPQVYAIVKAYTERRVRFHGLDPRELGLERYFRPLVQRIADNIEPDTSAGEPPVLPVLNRYRPVSSTSGVDFFTTRPVKPVTRSHVNAVVMDSGWEGQAADILDACAAVECFARNDHMGLVIQYGYLDVDHDYTPDSLYA
jgi:type III restriction enzyme